MSASSVKLKRSAERTRVHMRLDEEGNYFVKSAMVTDEFGIVADLQLRTGMSVTNGVQLMVFREKLVQAITTMTGLPRHVYQIDFFEQ